jgi:OmpA-OmpF porin, OOP family
LSLVPARATEREPEREVEPPEPVREIPHEPAPIDAIEGPRVRGSAGLMIEDRDQDGVPDLDDRCPILPGSVQDGGCPQFIRYDTRTGVVELLRTIRFTGKGAALPESSMEVIAELAAMLRANPNMKVRIDGHVHPQRKPRAALELSSERALAVARTLLERGVDRAQMEALACGSNRPVVPERSELRFRNERIGVQVIRPLPETGMPSTMGCEALEMPVLEAPAALREPEPAPPVQAPAKPTPSATPAPAPAPVPAPAATPAAPATKPSPKAAPTTGGVSLPNATPAAAVLALLARTPDGDADGDGRPNAKDECPLAPSGSGNGCPETHRVELEQGRIELLKSLRFEDDRAELHARSREQLDELAATLRANPQMKVRIEAHVADGAGSEPSLALTRKRAAELRKELGKRGVAPERLYAYGCGEGRPIAPNNVPWGRKKNERVELRLLDPVPASGVDSTEGCSASE